MYITFNMKYTETNRVLPEYSTMYITFNMKHTETNKVSSKC